MKPFIENVSYENIGRGYHFDPGPNSMLIQIMDPGCSFPKPMMNFKEVHQFNFWDEEIPTSFCPASGLISNDQGEEIASLLIKAMNNHTNVIVHCHAGICRSGAIAEVAIAMGFQDTEVFRLPNVLVKTKVLEALISKGVL